MNIAMSSLSQGGPMQLHPAPSGMLSGWSKTDTLGGLQGISTVAGMIAQIGQGNATAASYRSKAIDDQLQSTQEKVTGTGQVAGLREQLMNSLGKVNASYGASGVDTGQGVAQTTRNALGQANDQASALTLTSADIRSRRSMINSYSDKIAADQAQNAGILSAIGTGVSGLFSILSL